MIRKRTGLYFLFFTLLMISVFSFSPIVGGESAERVTLSGGRVDPRTAKSGTELVFRVGITSNSVPAEPVELVVEGNSFAMVEIDASDTNYSDGKLFLYKDTFDEGPQFYFFRCGNQTTHVSAFEVEKDRFFDSYHPDLAFAMMIYALPIVYFLFLLRRMSTDTTAFSSTLNELCKMLVDGEISPRKEEYAKDGTDEEESGHEEGSNEEASEEGSSPEKARPDLTEQGAEVEQR